MANSSLVFFGFTALSFLIVQATQVSKCKEKQMPPPKNEDITISDCENPPCKLRKGTVPAITMKIVPEKDAEGVTTNVNAQIVGIPLPFIGVDGTSACEHIYSEDGKTKVGCPLKSGQTYFYKNSFKVLDIYPKVKLTVHWGLVNNKTKEDISCFEIPARII